MVKHPKIHVTHIIVVTSDRHFPVTRAFPIRLAGANVSVIRPDRLPRRQNSTVWDVAGADFRYNLAFHPRWDGECSVLESVVLPFGSNGSLIRI